MHPRLLLPVLLVTTSLAAQSPFTTPAGFETRSGAGQSYNQSWQFAASRYAVSRLQCTDPTMPKGKMTLTGMQLRSMASTTKYSVSNGMGRTVKGMELLLGYYAGTMSKTFSQNHKGPLTTVYSNNKLSLPTLTAGVRQTWGNVATFSFSKPFVWDSSKGTILQDWYHTGGTMSNGSTSAASYYMDGITDSNSLANATTSYVPRAPTVGAICNDGSSTAKQSAYSIVNLSVYADSHPTASLRGKAQISGAATANTAPSAPVLAMLTLGGSDTGINVGAACNKVHVNTGFPLAYFTKTTFANGLALFGGAGGLPTTPFDWDSSWSSQPVYWQAAWSDSKTKQFSLTIATKLTTPIKPVYMDNVCDWIHGYVSSGRTRIQGPFAGGSSSRAYNPTERWTVK